MKPLVNIPRCWPCSECQREVQPEKVGTRFSEIVNFVPPCLVVCSACTRKLRLKLRKGESGFGGRWTIYRGRELRQCGNVLARSEDPFVRMQYTHDERSAPGILCTLCLEPVLFDLSRVPIQKAREAALSPPVSIICEGCAERFRLPRAPGVEAHYILGSRPAYVVFHGQVHLWFRGAYVRSHGVPAARLGYEDEKPRYVPCKICGHWIVSVERTSWGGASPYADLSRLYDEDTALSGICYPCIEERGLEVQGSYDRYVVFEGREYKCEAHGFLRHDHPRWAYHYEHDDRPGIFPCCECGSDITLRPGRRPQGSTEGATNNLHPPFRMLCDACVERLGLEIHEPTGPRRDTPWVVLRGEEFRRYLNVFGRTDDPRMSFMLYEAGRNVKPLPLP